jgi:hypothetical protein
MSDSKPPESFSTQLLRQDGALTDSHYQEHRMQLEQLLVRAERNEQRAKWVVVVAFFLGMALMFVGGSRVIGSFDPTDKGANPLSIALGVIYAIASLTFPIALASYYSRFRPNVRRARERLMEDSLHELQQQVRELRARLDKPKGDDET